MYFTWKKNHIRTINLKYQLQHGQRVWRMPDGLYSVSEIEEYLKKIGEKINDNINPSMKTY